MRFDASAIEVPDPRIVTCKFAKFSLTNCNINNG
jgi:hypothetical protein